MKKKAMKPLMVALCMLMGSAALMVLSACDPTPKQEKVPQIEKNGGKRPVNSVAQHVLDEAMEMLNEQTNADSSKACCEADSLAQN